jgi:hypothetical protein
MVRRFLSFVLTLAAITTLPARGSMQTRAVLPAEIAAQGASGPVRVIVRLAVPVQHEHMVADARGLAVQRAAIHVAQETALEGIAGLAEAPTLFRTLPAFAVTTDLAGLGALAAMPSVVAIEKDHQLQRMLLDTSSIIHSDVLWQQGTQGSGWSVAILDDGVEKTHSFLGGRVTAEACYSTTSTVLGLNSLCPNRVNSSTAVGSGVNCPGCDHGTHVAGIAAGRNTLFSGMARSANIIAMQVFSRANSGATIAYASDSIRALERVLELAGPGNIGRIGAVNMSIASAEVYTGACDSVDTTFTQAVDNLRAVGIPTIVAAGNAAYSDRVSFPACISPTISVGSVTKGGTLAPSSNSSSFLNLVAPGEGIRSSGVGDSYRVYSGTSMAAPHVAGAWTLLKSRIPGATVASVLRAFTQTGAVVAHPFTAFTFRSIRLDAAAGSLGPEGSPTSVAVAVFGTTVTASWAPPFDGTAHIGYHVEIVSAQTGASVGTINVGAATSFVTTLGNGTYLLRVRLITAGGQGEASNDIPFAVGPQFATEPPLAPIGLRSELMGQTVALTWNMPVESAPATSMVIEAGSVPGQTNFGTFDIGTAVTSVSVNNVQPGTYFVRLRARNAYGTSGPSNEVRVDVTGVGCVIPLPPTGLNATVVGSLVTLNWSPPAVIGTITGYVVEVGTAPGLSNIANANVGPATVLAATATPGVYYVRVRAQSACGQTGPSNEVAVVVP